MIHLKEVCADSWHAFFGGNERIQKSHCHITGDEQVVVDVVECGCMAKEM